MGHYPPELLSCYWLFTRDRAQEAPTQAPSSDGCGERLPGPTVRAPKEEETEQLSVGPALELHRQSVYKHCLLQPDAQPYPAIVEGGEGALRLFACQMVGPMSK